MQKPQNVHFHRVYSAAAVDRVVLWNANKKQMWFPALQRLPTPNKFNQEVMIYNGDVSIAEAGSCQLLALGSEHNTQYRLGDLMSQSSDVEVVRGLRELPETVIPGTQDHHLEDCIVINAPKVFRYCIAEPDPTLAKLGWGSPILLEHVQKPKVEQPSELMAHGFDPSEDCVHFVGWVNWRLSPTVIADWEKIQDLQVKICLYSSHLLEDMRLEVPVPQKPVPAPKSTTNRERSQWVKK